MRITVAVPTIAGRSNYLRWALQTCVTQNHDFEILVSDNSPGDAREVVESFRDPRVRYVRPPAYLPMSAHWDFILTQVSGDLLTIIGDDDGLMPGCIRHVAEIYQNAGGNLPIHHALGNYCWPDFPDEALRGTFHFLHAVGWGMSERDSSAYLSAAAGGKVRYVDGPMVYHNFVPMRLLRTLKGDGVFFRRACPDIYSSFAVAANTPRFVSTQELLTISGQGAKANGAAVESGGGNQFIAEMQARYAPRYDSRTIQLHLLDCLIEVAQHFNRPELLSNVAYHQHIARAFVEAGRMRPPLRRREMCGLIAIARRHGIMTVTGIVLAARKLANIVPSARGPHLGQGQQDFSEDDVIKLDPHRIRNIFDATMAIDGILTNASHNRSRMGAIPASSPLPHPDDGRPSGSSEASIKPGSRSF